MFSSVLCLITRLQSGIQPNLRTNSALRPCRSRDPHSVNSLRPCRVSCKPPECTDQDFIRWKMEILRPTDRAAHTSQFSFLSLLFCLLVFFVQSTRRELSLLSSCLATTLEHGSHRIPQRTPKATPLRFRVHRH